MPGLLLLLVVIIGLYLLLVRGWLFKMAIISVFMVATPLFLLACGVSFGWAIGVPALILLLAAGTTRTEG